MEDKDNKINGFQFVVLGAFLADGLFLGIGIFNIFFLAKQNAWIVTLFGLLIGLIAILLIIYIMNYKPDENIIIKNKHVFGKIIGSIINFILLCYTLFILIIVLHGGTVFAITMYLTKTPTIVIYSIYIATALYAAIKGIEAISRTGEILFFMAIINVGFISLSLLSHFNANDLLPILPKGFMSIIKPTFIYFSYAFAPLILLMAIPKNKIKNNKNFHKQLILGFLIGGLLMFLVYFIIPGVITPNLVDLYRFPAYYVQRKISIGGAINNVENITSVHWLFHVFMTASMCIFFLITYLKSTFKFKKEKVLNIITIVLSIVMILIANKSFTNPASILEFTIKVFPYMIIIGLLLLLMITCLIIFIRKRKEHKAT